MSHEPVPDTLSPPTERGPVSQDFSGALRQSQIDVEQEKAALARRLHDDLGGLLVGAIMDMGWIAQQPGHAEVVKEKLARATALLHSAIDLKRILIENLRPTLLDHVGLFATLRWHMKATCDAAGVVYVERYPDVEVNFAADIKIVVFRIVQEALKYFLSEGEVRGISLEVEIIDDNLHCQLASEYLEPRGDPLSESPETAMTHRAQRVGGSLRLLKGASGNRMHLNVPVSRVAA
jgi:signal transduction histidine kinase